MYTQGDAKFLVAVRLYFYNPEAFDIILSNPSHPLYNDCVLLPRAIEALMQQSMEPYMQTYINLLKINGIHESEDKAMIGSPEDLS